MMLGIIIIVLGTAFLLRNLGVISFDAGFWSVFYPLVLIVIGLFIMLVTHKGRKLLRWIQDKLFRVAKKDR